MIPGLGWLGRSDLRNSLILAELFLGGWLISGIGRIQACLVALIAFAAFAWINQKLVLGGESDCGCFGDFRVHPIATGIFDVGAVVCLAVTLLSAYRRDRSAFWPAVSSAAGVAVCLGALAGIGFSKFGSIDLAPQQSDE